MAQKETIYHLNEILEELKSSEGLPQGLTTEAQLWDEILKKEIFLMPEQLFPLIQEVYQKSYPKDTPVKPLGTEYSVECSNARKITSVRADVTVLIGFHDIYHFECESKSETKHCGRKHGIIKYKLYSNRCKNKLKFRDFAGNSKIGLTKMKKENSLYLLNKIIKLSQEVYISRI